MINFHRKKWSSSSKTCEETSHKGVDKSRRNEIKNILMSKCYLCRIVVGLTGAFINYIETLLYSTQNTH